MNVVQWVGAALAVIGAAEFALFSQLAKVRSTIADKKTILYANATLNIVVGLLLVLIFR
jgi:hypothetical protein